jgi:D-glycero-D-manno-heptose 1,7-bisphosphate phosphatase
MKRPAIFLDRDGTLVEEVNYLSRVHDLKIFPFTPEALRLLKLNGFAIVVITNQSGIGRGIFDEKDMHSIHKQLDRELPELIEAYYFCTHVPDDMCECRKPGIGMINKACEELGITREGSWMIGDKSIDVEAGKNAGISTILVRTGYGATHSGLSEVVPDFIEADLLAAARRIVDSSL